MRTTNNIRPDSRIWYLQCKTVLHWRTIFNFGLKKTRKRMNIETNTNSILFSQIRLIRFHQLPCWKQRNALMKVPIKFYDQNQRKQIEPPHDKTNKMACAPSVDSDQPGHPPSLIRVFVVRMKKAWVLCYTLSAPRRLWSDWAEAEADLSLRWAHSHFVCFVMWLLRLTMTPSIKRRRNRSYIICLYHIITNVRQIVLGEQETAYLFVSGKREGWRIPSKPSYKGSKTAKYWSTIKRHRLSDHVLILGCNRFQCHWLMLVCVILMTVALQ